MLEQTLPCHEGCEQLGIAHMLYITLVVKPLNKMIQSMLPTAFEYL